MCEDRDAKACIKAEPHPISRTENLGGWLVTVTAPNLGISEFALQNVVLDIVIPPHRSVPGLPVPVTLHLEAGV